MAQARIASRLVNSLFPTKVISADAEETRRCNSCLPRSILHEGTRGRGTAFVRRYEEALRAGQRSLRLPPLADTQRKRVCGHAPQQERRAVVLLSAGFDGRSLLDAGLSRRGGFAPDSSYLPAVETLQERSDVGAFILLPQLRRRINFCNQAIDVQGSQPFGSLPDLIHETTNRLRLGIRVQRLARRNVVQGR
jgi:hypothetical protein